MLANPVGVRHLAGKKCQMTTRTIGP